jgi:arsenite methyltransferase
MSAFQETMKTITIFDKPLCCSTGVCGPTVDPALARFADDLRWLAEQGIPVRRHNPAQDVSAFLSDPVIRLAMRDGGEDVLPVVVAGGEEKSRRRYPTRDELAAWAELASAPATDAIEKGDCCGGSRCC